MNSLRPSDTEVPSYFLSGLLSGIGNFVTNTVPNFVTQTIPNTIGNIAKGQFAQGLGGLYTGVDKVLGGILPGGQALGSGYLGQLYTGADKMLGGYLPNIGGGAAAGGAGYTPQYVAAQKAFNALPGPAGANGLRPGQVGTSFNGGPMTVSSVNTPLAGGGMSTLDKIANVAGIAGTLGMMLSGKGGGGSPQAQYRQITGGGGSSLRPGIGSAGREAAASGTGVGVGGASSRGQGKNQTGGLDQITSGVSESEAIMRKTKEIQDDFEKFLKEQGEGYRYDAVSPMDAARDATPVSPDFTSSDLGTSYQLLR